jgi:hypothetical protein
MSSFETTNKEVVMNTQELIDWARDCRKQGFHTNLERVADALEAQGREIDQLRAQLEAQGVGVVESAVHGAGGFHVRLVDGAAMPSVGTKLYTPPAPAAPKVVVVGDSITHKVDGQWVHEVTQYDDDGKVVSKTSEPLEPAIRVINLLDALRDPSILLPATKDQP